MFLFLLLGNIHYGTFSIVALDPETEEIGIAVASRVLDVGYIVPWLDANAGGIATQALTNPYFGPWGLKLLKKGYSPDSILSILLKKDTMPEDRQIGIVDLDGNSISFTGRNCLKWAGHIEDKYVAIQGNILAGEKVIQAMFKTFKETKGPLPERLLSALEAGEKAGGDKRGKQSAALYVVKKHGGYLGVDDRLVDLKVVDNQEPVKELRREYELWQYAFLAPAYLRLAKEAGGKEKNIFIERAHSLMQKALTSKIDKPEVYNSLAWEFAVMKMYPEETIKAALRAHKLAPDDPNIMDTVAEAYYAAGLPDEAVKWEERALKLQPDNEFFKKQLEKFRKAAESKH